jgi:hypothetical protein
MSAEPDTLFPRESKLHSLFGKTNWVTPVTEVDEMPVTMVRRRKP